VVLQLFLNTLVCERGKWKRTDVFSTADAVWKLPRADRMALWTELGPFPSLRRIRLRGYRCPVDDEEFAFILRGIDGSRVDELFLWGEWSSFALATPSHDCWFDLHDRRWRTRVQKSSALARFHSSSLSITTASTVFLTLHKLSSKLT